MTVTRACSLRQIRLLWRVTDKRRVITAALYAHPAGIELRVFLGPEERDDTLSTQVEKIDMSVLEQRAEDLRKVLAERGWVPPPEQPEAFG